MKGKRALTVFSQLSEFTRLYPIIGQMHEILVLILSSRTEGSGESTQCETLGKSATIRESNHGSGAC